MILLTSDEQHVALLPADGLDPDRSSRDDVVEDAELADPESGIFFQNQIAALYLGRLIDPRPRPGYEAVLEVRVEAPEPITVDDVVLRFADGHREYLQVKEAVAPGSEAWKKLWRDFAVQRGKEDFTDADWIVLWLGSHQGWSGILKKLCKTAGGSKDEGEWHRRLNRKAKEMLESLEPILAEHLEGRSALSLLACCKVETSEAERIRSDLVPSFMPESNVERWQLYDTLLRKTAEHARFRKPFSKGELLRELAQEGVEIPGSAVLPEVLLEIWLDRVVRVDRELLRYFERQGAPLLEHVYVELELDPQPAGLAGRPGEDPRREHLLGRRMSIREVLDLDPAEHPGITRRWLLKGDPGSGKTSLLRHLARKLAEDGGKPWVPVFESLPRLLREPRSLFEGIEQDLHRADLPGAEVRRALESEAEEGRLLFLLDGLDEVPEELRERAERFLGDLAQSWPKSPVVVATRPIGAAPPGPAYRELEVLELDGERRRAFLAQWFARGGEKYQLQLGQRRNRPGASRLVRQKLRRPDSPGGREVGQRARSLRHARQCLGVDSEPVDGRLLGSRGRYRGRPIGGRPGRSCRGAPRPARPARRRLREPGTGVPFGLPGPRGSVDRVRDPGLSRAAVVRPQPAFDGRS